MCVLPAFHTQLNQSWRLEYGSRIAVELGFPAHHSQQQLTPRSVQQSCTNITSAGPCDTPRRYALPPSGSTPTSRRGKLRLRGINSVPKSHCWWESHLSSTLSSVFILGSPGHPLNRASLSRVKQRSREGKTNKQTGSICAVVATARSTLVTFFSL